MLNGCTGSVGMWLGTRSVLHILRVGSRLKSLKMDTSVNPGELIRSLNSQWSLLQSVPFLVQMLFSFESGFSRGEKGNS